MSSRLASDFERQLRSGLTECGIGAGSRVLVALSGGPDSTALLLALCAVSATTGITVEAAHFNHKTRGAESDLDEEFCRRVCDELGVRAHFGSLDVASDESLSEASMRGSRYRFLTETAIETGAAGIATAHTLDDQAETVLLAITRGSGLRGLTGMSHVSVRLDDQTGKGVKVFRPFLNVRKSSTAEYCAERECEPREDPSNLDVRYARNRVRQIVLPELANVNPNVIESVARLAANLRDDLALIDGTISRYHAQVSLSGLSDLSRAALATIPDEAVAHVLVAAFAAAAGSSENLERIHIKAMTEAAAGGSGRALDLPNGVRMIVDHDAVRFEDAESPDEQCPYPQSIEEIELEVPFSFEFSDGSKLTASTGRPPESFARLTRWQTALNPQTVKSPLKIRSRTDGDRFHPLGMSEQVKLQDFMVNEHVPSRWRDRVPLLVADKGIAWVAGHRVAEWAKLPQDSDDALLIEYHPAKVTGSSPASG